VDIRCQLHVLQQISLSKGERSYFILLLPNQGNDSVDVTWPSHLQMNRSSLPAVKFGRFKPFFNGFHGKSVVWIGVPNKMEQNKQNEVDLLETYC